VFRILFFTLSPLLPTSPAPLPLVTIIGPTAVGKTEAAIQLAERLNAEIISADSRLFYRGMDIGTAKPTPAEMARAPHHLIDVADPNDVWSLARFQQEAQRVIAEVHARGRLPLLVGGTGQYVRAVIEGWTPPPAAPDTRLRDALAAWAEQVTPDGLHARLARLDPESAASIDPRNVRRTIRALEVILSTGRRFSEQRQRADSPYRLLILGLIRPRDELYARIDARIAAMFAAGFVDEVRALLSRGYTPKLPTLSAIGYQQVCAYLQGEMSMDDVVMLMKRQTRQFVRRQANWFKADDPQIHWFTASENAVDSMAQAIQDWLASA
jgi:tRNA dimethylallyltransferase